MNWLHYLLEANLYLGVFYLGYYLFLSRETYYTLNRVYLLFSCIAAFALPVLQLGILKPVEQPVTAVNFAFGPQASGFVPVTTRTDISPAFTWQNALVDIYLTGVAILFLVLLMKLYSLWKLTRSQNSGQQNGYKLVYMEQSGTAFSFFNYLFIGTKVEGADTIIKHELVHIRQKHSFDIIFIELLKIVNWFNPFIYLIQFSLKTLHEYIADERTATEETDALAYSSFLVNNAYGLSGSSITHSFFNYNLLKKRIIMLHQKRSGSLARLKYLVAVPICAGLLCASTLAFSKSYGWVDIGPHRIDKNNKTPQVAEPHRHLLVHQNGISTLTDKFSYKRDNGTVRFYTAYNLSNKDKADLAKKGIEVSVLSDVMVEVRENKLTGENPLASGFTNSGNKYKVNWITHENKTNYIVAIYDKNGSKLLHAERAATVAGLTALGEKYGFKFSALTIMPDDTAKRVPPPPPPAPPVKRVVFSAPKDPKATTSKGYKYAEGLTVIDGKSDMQVMIYEKNRDIKVFHKNTMSADAAKLLKDKYGYVFPAHFKMPPPPPAPPVGAINNKVAPTGKMPPPPAPPVSSVDRRPPPPPPAGAIMNDVPANAPKTNFSYKSILYVPAKTEPTVQMPLIIVNGTVYHPKEALKKGGSIYFSADSVIGHSPDDVNQKKKWGALAANGVVELFGKQPTVTVSN